MRATILVDDQAGPEAPAEHGFSVWVESGSDPWLELLKLIPGICLEPVGGLFDCCGMAGIMGFKKGFHESSIAVGASLREKIDRLHPERLLTDCLSCRIQFNQTLPYEVSHPVEILNAAYRSWR
jgi:glycerol-3-phosphate dehydrogenase subunit C